MSDIWLKNYFLVDFKKLKEDLVFSSLIELLRAEREDRIEIVLEKYSNFLLALKEQDLSEYIKQALPAIKITKRTEGELGIINQFLGFNHSGFKSSLVAKFPEYRGILEELPEFFNSKQKIAISDIKELQKTRTFVFEEGILRPIQTGEDTKFANLKGYVKEKEILFNNTKALLDGKCASNVLLYGDAGCGKSSSVRALLFEFPTLNMVQIFKNELINLDKLYEILKQSKEKFIIFADDISFDENDRDLSEMKAVLEGSLIQCPDNAVIYATSNRRHLVRESFKSREGDEIHLSDTINEISSLSERFGITILFARPTNEQFIDIVLKLADDYSIDMDKTELIKLAQRHALTKGSRSPRIARQLIENIKAKL